MNAELMKDILEITRSANVSPVQSDAKAALIQAVVVVSHAILIIIYIFQVRYATI